MTEPSPAPFEITDRPDPPRPRWMSGYARWILIAIAALVVARLIWGYVAARRLQRTIDQLTASGAPVTFAQLQANKIPDARNAALVWMQAFDAVDETHDTPATSNYSFNAYPPYPATFYTLMETGVPANDRAISLARQARSMPEMNWQVALKAPSDERIYAPLNKSRALANVLADAAIYSQMHGDDAEAIERVRDVMSLAQADDQYPTFVSDLVSIGINAMAMDRAKKINAQIQSLSNDPSNATTRPLKGPATREQIKSLIRDLIALADDRASTRRTLQCERADELEQLRASRRGMHLLGPMFDAEAARYSHLIDAVIDAATQATLPDAMNALAAIPGEQNLPAALRLPPGGWKPLADAPRLSRFGDPYSPRTINAYIITAFRVRLEMRLAAVALATRVYWIDHHRWPTSIDELVPNYLPAIPADPFSSKGKTIGYMLIKGGLPDGGDRPVIFNPQDRDDDRIDPTIVPPEPIFSWMVRDGLQFRDVTMWSPAPTTQPADDTSK